MRCALLCLLILCAACTAPPDSGQAAPTTAAPGRAYTLAQAQQMDAPALAITADGLLAAWVGSDARGVHQDARRLSADGLDEVVTLPLPPTHPYDQSLLPGDNGRRIALAGRGRWR